MKKVYEGVKQDIQTGKELLLEIRENLKEFHTVWEEHKNAEDPFLWMFRDDSNEDGEPNPYKTALLEKVDFRLQQLMEEQNNRGNWSILSNEPSYTTFKGRDQGCRITAPKNVNNEKQHRQFQEIHETRNSEDQQPLEDYCDLLYCHFNTTPYLNERSDISVTYLGRDDGTSDISPSFRITPEAYCNGKLRNGTKFNILLDTGASGCYLSKHFYENNKILQEQPKFKTQGRSIIVGNGEAVPILFAVQVRFQIQEHWFETIALVANITKEVSLVLGMKPMTELEGAVHCNTREFSFKHRSPYVYPEETQTIGPRQRRTVKFRVPFRDELSGYGVLKAWINGEERTVKTKLTRNQTLLVVTNNTDNEVKLDRDSPIGILDVRSMGYYYIAYEDLMRQMGEGSTRKFMQFAEYSHPIETREGTEEEHKAQDNEAAQKEDGRERFHRAKVAEDPKDPFPWLQPDDPRRFKSDAQILEETIDLEKANLTRSEKKRLRRLIYKHREAFSLRDEIGECPNIKADISVKDPTPFFVRPFPIKEEDKAFMDAQMARLVALGILTVNSTTHTSPVMLITRKLTNDKRPVVDFRVLNTRILRRNTSIPLMREVLGILGESGCEVISVLDLKDAYHSIPLTEESKEFCGILPYFGSFVYRYEVLPMGIACAPQIWMDYVNTLLRNLKHKEKFIAIMDDLLVHSKKKDHWQLLEDLFKSIIKNGLKLSPKKCQLFQTKFTYMGNEFNIKKGKINIKPLADRLDAIKNIPKPKTAKDCKKFCGVVNYLSLFCKDLQKILKPITQLTRKEAPFHWTEAHDKAFEEVKKTVSSAPILSLPNASGRFILYADTSREHTGSSLWQIQEGKPALLGYASKTLPDACKRYSVTELEMTGLLINIGLWKHLLVRTEFDAAVDHQAVVQIMKAKTEPPSQRIMRLLERLSNYSFNLFYVKGKDMILADYLSRHRLCDDDPNDLIPISFKRCKVEEPERCLITTRAKTRADNKELPDMKEINWEVKPEYDRTRPTAKVVKRQQTQTREFTAARKIVEKYRKRRQPTTPRNEVKPKEPTKLGHDRGTRRRENPPENPQAQPPAEHDWEPEPDWEPQQDTERPANWQTEHPKAIVNDPTEEVLAEPEFNLPQDNDFHIPPSLEQQISGQADTRHLPKQIDLDKVMEKLRHKILRNTHLTHDLKDLTGAYLQSPAFKDVYKYLNSGYLPTNSRTAKITVIKSKSFMLLDKLLFRIETTRDGGAEALLCIPTSKVDLVLRQYHDSMVGCHQGITKTYRTISQRFHIPNLAAHIRAYITGCHICQQFKQGSKIDRPYQKRININVPALSKISMDIKDMPNQDDGYTSILLILCEVSNYIVAIPIKNHQAAHIVEKIKDGFVKYFGMPRQIICDLDPAFTSGTFKNFCQHWGTELVFISPTNHKSLLAEHGIKSLAALLTKHLEKLGNNWTEYLPYAMLSYNSFSTPNLDNLSPFHLTFGRQANIVAKLEIDTKQIHSGTARDAYEKLKSQLKYLQQQITKFRDARSDLINKNKIGYSFQTGQIVYMFQPRGALLQSGTRKIACHFVGPLVIYKALAPTMFLLMSLDGKVYPHLVEETRIKPGFIRTPLGNASTLSELKSMLVSHNNQ